MLKMEQDRKKSSRNSFHLYHMLDLNTGKNQPDSSREKGKKNKKKTYLKLFLYNESW